VSDDGVYVGWVFACAFKEGIAADFWLFVFHVSSPFDRKVNSILSFPYTSISANARFFSPSSSRIHLGMRILPLASISTLGFKSRGGILFSGKKWEFKVFYP